MNVSLKKEVMVWQKIAGNTGECEMSSGGGER